jgi:alpha-tubulin suppressor-like RCC1 family protein
VLGSDRDEHSFEPVAVDTDQRFTWLSSGETHTCGGAYDGEIYCWGSNFYGELADGRMLRAYAPQRVETDQTFVDVIAADHTTCGINESGELHCWGDNRTGELADGTFRSKSRIVRSGGDYQFDTVSLGEAHGCGLESEGTVVCWGQNFYGSFGITTEEPYLAEPVLVHPRNSWAGLTNGFYHHCVINESGLVSCAGRNDHGQAGIGRTVESTQLERVDHDGVFTSVTAGYYRTCALKADGKAWCWGNNNGGGLGDGTYQSRTAPVEVDTDLAFDSLMLGQFHACGVDVQGRAHCWGLAAWGRLGAGENVGDVASPVAVVGRKTFSELVAGRDFTCGLSEDGPTYCWGADFDGELGLGEGAFTGSEYSASPQVVAGDHDFTSLAAGVDHVCGLNADGDIFCWGGGFFGQLADGARVSSPTPVVLQMPE